jgi:hypothetical protein
MATPQVVRRWIMTGAVAAVTITGTIYGATLKDDTEVKKVCWHIYHFTNRIWIRARQICTPF